MQETWVQFLGELIPWGRDRLPTPVFLGFPGGSDCKKSARDAEDLDLIPGLGGSPGEGHGNPLLYSCLENSMDRRCCWGTVHRVSESDTTEQLTQTLASSKSMAQGETMRTVYSLWKVHPLGDPSPLPRLKSQELKSPH